MSKKHLYLGASGEETAANFLKENGYKIIVRNYKTKLGEIDIIAKDKDTFAFIEVKTRRSNRFGSSLEAISKVKQRQISKAALNFIRKNNLLDKKARFDVVSVIYSANDKCGLELIKNAFELDERYVI